MDKRLASTPIAGGARVGMDVLIALIIMDYLSQVTPAEIHPNLEAALVILVAGGAGLPREVAA
jgi:hypothetical protein